MSSSCLSVQPQVLAVIGQLARVRVERGRACMSLVSSRRCSLQLKPSVVNQFRYTNRCKISVSKRRVHLGVFCCEAEPELELTEENIEQALLDARKELLQLFDESVGMTGTAELADLDGPFVKIRLKGRFWHERALVVARLGNYLQKRIPEIVEVEIEDISQLDDSAANF
eukprot:jgi/Mesen1/11009/ME000098S10403